MSKHPVWKAFLQVLHLALNVFLAASLFACSWIYLTPYFRLERRPEGDYFRNLPADTIEVLAVGSSHVQYSFNPAAFYAMTGAYAYNLGSMCQPFDATYWILKEALRTQSPSLIFVDIYTLLPQSQNCYADETYYIAGDFLSPDYRDEMLKNAAKLDEKTKLMYRFDLYMNHDLWKEMDLSDPASIRAAAAPYQGLNSTLGYLIREMNEFTYTPLAVLEPLEKVELTAEQKEQIDDIIQLGKENDIEIVFTIAPYLQNQESADTMAAVWAYLEEKDIPYIDEIAASPNHWFLNMDGDTAHNNSWGAEIVTRDYAQYALDHDLVTPSEENLEIKAVLSGLMDETAATLMRPENINIYDLLVDASLYPCITVLRFGASSVHGLGEYEGSALNALGFTKDFTSDYRTPYYAICQDGRLLYESGEPFTAEINGHTVEITADDILIDGESVSAPGEMQIVFLGDDFSWRNPLGIDYASRWFWKNGCDSWECTVQPSE
jgi:hypothetical protein